MRISLSVLLESVNTELLFQVSAAKCGLIPNIKFWKQLFDLAGREIQCIESLPSYMETLHAKNNLTPKMYETDCGFFYSM